MTRVTLSLVSHTNVGKTTLARTLLGADIGEVRDAPHVTEFADGHPLITTDQGDELRLWDTPGFGDSARLARRLLASGNPLGWFLSQVWDRWTDRGFWASQQAMRHVQAESDVVLYLVNAAESPAAAGYVAPEMDLLAWVGKPVLVLLNQLGEPRAPEHEAADVQAWQAHLARWPLVRAVLPLDAFARCWVHEQTLLRAVQRLLAGQVMATTADALKAGMPSVSDVHAAHMDVAGARLANVRLANAHLANVQFANAHLANAHLASAQLAGAQAEPAHARSAHNAPEAAAQPEKAAAMARLAAAWAARNQQRFDASMAALAQSLARMALARVVAEDGPSLRDRLRHIGSSLGAALGGGPGAHGGHASPHAQADAHARDRPAASAAAASAAGSVPAPAAAPAAQALATLLQTEVQASTDRLLALHGLAGQARGDEILQRVAGQFALRQRVPEGKAAFVGGAVTGALAGLKADIVSGGLTLGGGMLAGALIGALGAAGVARGVNVVRGTGQSWLRVADEAMGAFVESALLRYLAVAHFGRGRGQWVQGEAPPHWPAAVAAVLTDDRLAIEPALRALWAARDPKAQADAVAVDPAPLAAQLQPLLAAAAQEVLARLYPQGGMTALGRRSA